MQQHFNSLKLRNSKRYILGLLTWYLLACTFVPLKAQTQNNSTSLKISGNRFITGLNHKNHKFLALTFQEYYEFDPTDNVGWKRFSYKRNDLDSTQVFIENLLYVPTDKGTYFALNGSGCVYSFQDSSIVRIDESFPHRNQYGASIFFEKDKIYMYGGYGFFQHKAFMTEFSLKNPQWFAFGYNQDSKLPPGRNNLLAQFNPSTRMFYIAEGYSNPTPEFLGSEKILHDDVWRLDLNTRMWEKLGYIPKRNLIEYYATPFIAGNKVYLLETGQSKITYCIDIENNNIKAYNARANQNHIIGSTYAPIYNPNNGYALFIMNSSTGLEFNQFELRAILFKEFESRLVFSRPYYTPTYWYFGGSFLLFLTPIAIWVSVKTYQRKQQRKKLIRAEARKLVFNVTQKTMQFDGELIPFMDEEMDLLMFFCENNWEIPNLKLIEAIRIAQESNEVLKKRKTRIIENINRQFAFGTRLSEPFILEIKDQNDRRYKEYLVNPLYLDQMQVIS